MLSFVIISLSQMNTRVHVKAHPSQLKISPITSRHLLDLFPFGLILDHNMHILGAGEKVNSYFLC